MRDPWKVLSKMPFPKVWLIAALSSMLAWAQESPKVNAAASNIQVASIVARMQQAQSNARPTAPYHVVRNYRLFNEKGEIPSSEVWAAVDYLPPKQKTFVIQKRVGSSRGEEVVRRILQHESQMSGESWSAAALDNSNYFFGYLGETALDGNPCYLLNLNPKRNEVDLIRGRVWIDRHSFRVRRIEGQMAKNPSWLLKKVDLKIEFADVGGAFLQTRMEAVAEVRFLGSQTLRSQTIDARVGELTAQKTQLAAGIRNPHSMRIPATVIVPLDHHH